MGAPLTEKEIEQLFYNALAEVGQSEMERLITENDLGGGLLAILGRVLPKVLVRVNQHQTEILAALPQPE
jgi:hypothetical protein